MAKSELGGKRQCLSCGAKFFDLNKDPIICPKCGAAFQIAAPARVAQRAAAVEDDETPVASVEIVSIEEVDVDGEKVEVVEDDIEIEDDGADDTFLEEEEEDNDDVADLIDGDLETDEEN